MSTKFKFYDIDNVLKQADLIFSLVINNKHYIIYELEEEKNLEYDVMHVGEYEEIDNKPCIYEVSEEEMMAVKEKIDIILNTIE